MTVSVLWLDNDPAHNAGFVEAMRRVGIRVTQVTSVTAAETCLREESFDALLLDVMVPVDPEEYDAGYDFDTTENTSATGLAFYRKHSAELASQRTSVVVLTVRLDKHIRDSFIAAGLPPDNFFTKMELRRAATFVDAVRKRLAQAHDLRDA